MGGLLHLVQRGAWAGCGPPSPLIAVPDVTAHPSTASVPIAVSLYDDPLLCGFNVAIKGLTILPLSPSSIIWYQRKLGSKQAYHVVHQPWQPVSRGLAVFADAWLSDWLAEISAELRETVAH